MAPVGTPAACFHWWLAFSCAQVSSASLYWCSTVDSGVWAGTARSTSGLSPTAPLGAPGAVDARSAAAAGPALGAAPAAALLVATLGFAPAFLALHSAAWATPAA